jgi:hypothetical protein
MIGSGQTRPTTFVLLLVWIVLQPVSGWAQERDGWTPEILQQNLQTGGDDLAVSEQVNQRSKKKSQYLPDYSYAGYRWGEVSLPTSEGTVVEAVDHGVVPDDGSDDTEALLRTMEVADSIQGPVIVRLPAGRILLREILFIERGNIVVQGQGSGREGTTLTVTRPMREMEVPQEYESRLSDGTSPFSWQGGVLWSRVAPEKQRSSKSPITEATVGRRGHRVFYLEHGTGIQSGDVIRLRWFNRSGENSTFLHHVYCSSDLSYGGRLVDPQKELVTQEVTVTEVEGRRITVKEPLLHDIRPDWGVDVTRAQLLEEIGITGLRIVFPDVEYAGHHKEQGYNGVYLNNVIHGWIQDVTVENVDAGFIFSKRTKNITAQKIQVNGRNGHHGILVRGYGILVEDFEVHANFLHSLTFGTAARSSVYTGGYVWMAKLDQHRGVNHQNLYEDLEIEYIRPFPHPLFRHGGSEATWGPTAGAFNTFWNLSVKTRRSEGKSVWMVGKETEAPRGRIIGLHSVSGPRLDIEYGPASHVEGLNQSGIAVPSLYKYQHRRRVQGRRGPSISILRPAQKKRVQPGVSTTVEAVVQGRSGSGQRVIFYADGKEIGTDQSGADGWSTTWTPSEKGPHSLYAVLVDDRGRRVRSRSRSCTGGDQIVWAGSEEGELGGNYPNPFSHESTIQYAIREMSMVRIELFDVRGRLVRVLVNQKKTIGQHHVHINGSTLSSGVYLYRLTTKNYVDFGKSVVIH